MLSREENTPALYAKVLDKSMTLGIDLLSDIFLHPLLDPKDVEKERMVILQEIKMVEDTPDDLIHDLFNRVCWGNHPLGYPILGTSDLVQSFTRDQILRFYKITHRAASSSVQQETFTIRK